MTSNMIAREPAIGRRTLLKVGSAGAAALLFAPIIARAASDMGGALSPDASIYPKKAFAQTSESAALKIMYGADATASDKIQLDAPDIAENGAVVPVTVSTDMPNVTSISLLALDNPYTMAASYKLTADAIPNIASRLKLAKTTKVVAIVEAGGKLYSTSKPVKVTLGGCG